MLAFAPPKRFMVHRYSAVRELNLGRMAYKNSTNVSEKWRKKHPELPGSEQMKSSFGLLEGMATQNFTSGTLQPDTKSYPIPENDDPLELRMKFSLALELHAAIRGGNLLRVINSVRNGADPNIMIMHPSYRCKPPRSILERSKHPRDQTYSDDYLNGGLLAVKYGNPRIVEFLALNGWDPNSHEPTSVNRFGVAGHIAVFCRTIDCLQIVLRAGWNPNSLDRAGYTAGHLAIKYNLPSHFKALAAGGMDLNQRYPGDRNDYDSHNCNLGDYAIRVLKNKTKKPANDSVPKSIAGLAFFQACVEHGWDPNCKGFHGLKTAPFYAVCKRNPELLRFLLGHGLVLERSDLVMRYNPPRSHVGHPSIGNKLSALKEEDFSRFMGVLKDFGIRLPWATEFSHLAGADSDEFNFTALFLVNTFSWLAWPFRNKKTKEKISGDS